MILPNRKFNAVYLALLLVDRQTGRDKWHKRSVSYTLYAIYLAPTVYVVGLEVRCNVLK